MSNEEALIAWFRASTSYINAHRGKTFVIHLGGDALAHHNLSGIIHDLTLLHSLGVKLVLVHGARPQISAALAETGQVSVYENALRITEAEHMEIIKNTVGKLSIDLQASFSMGLSNSPMYGANISVCHGNYVTAKPYGVVNGIDFHLTGKVRKIQTDNIEHQLNGGHIVLLSNLGHSLTGEVFNLSAEEVATEVAVALDADKLIMFTPGGGLLDEKQQLITTLNAEEAERLIKEYSDGDERKDSLVLGLSAALRAYRQGVPRSHLVSYEEDGVLLLELFTKEGRGTLLSQDTLEELRTAGIHDVGGILNLIDRWKKPEFWWSALAICWRRKSQILWWLNWKAPLSDAQRFIRCVKNPARSPVLPSMLTIRERSSASVSCPSWKGRRSSRTLPMYMR